MKITTSTETYNRFSRDMDVNAGTTLSDSASRWEVGQQIFEMWLENGSEGNSKYESQGLDEFEFASWQCEASWNG